MTSTKRSSLIRRLQTTVPRGSPLDHHDLAALGVSSALAHHYEDSGWLSRLGRGVFMFPNNTLREQDCLKFLARRLPGLHVGGKTALAWRGVRHNLPAHEPLWLWGDAKARIPAWFRQRFSARYTARNPFAPTLPTNFGLHSLPETPGGVPVSAPERAVIELLSEVGIHQGIEEARNILDGVRSLRPEILKNLLAHCRRVKVMRLCVLWAEELGLPWADAARNAAGRRLGSSRWTARLKDGTTLTLKA
jgi:hypothetical protein